MAYKLQLKRGLLASLPNGSVGEPLFTTDTFDLYVGKGDGNNVKLQKFIASGSSSQFLKGDGSLDSTTYQGVLSGSGIVKSTGGTISYLTDNTANWDAAYNDKINSASVSGTTTKTLTLTQQDGGTITASWSDYDTAPVTSVFGRTGAVIAVSGDYTTSLVTEGTNLYYTDARARAAITLTTTGSSGSATYIGGTLNIPTYTLAGLGGVPTSRSLTINGTSYDLSADRSWSVGTVTSIDMSVPTGFAITGNPITSSGTLALAFATGYSLPTNASQTNWDAAYNDKINSASVTGTTTKTLTLNQQDGGTITASWTDINTDAVTSVFGRTGAVVATSGDYTTTQVTEGTNLYFTDARARAAISLTTTGSSGASTYVGGVLNVPNYTLSGLGGVPTSRTLTINGTAYDLSADRSWTIPTHDAVTIGTANGLSLAGQVLSLGLSSSTTNGALSSTDWSTFNSKQSALSGSGLVKSTSGTISYITDNSTNWNTAYNDSIVSAAVSGTTTKTLTLTQQDGGTVTASWTDYDTAPVTSVFGRTGAVVAANGDYTTTQVTEGTNLYYTDTRSRAALSFTAGSGAYNSTTGVITIPTNTNQLTNGAAFITLGSLSATSPLSYNSGTGAFSISQAGAGTNGYLSASDWNKFNNIVPAGTPTTGDYVFYNGSNLAYRGLLATSPLSYNISTGTFSISQASGSTNGYLSSTDWTTFNNKQNALTNPVTGTGTTNYVTKWTSSSAVGNSLIYDNGTSVGINETTPSEGKLVVNNPSGSTNNGTSGNTLYLKAQTANANLIRFSGAIATDLLLGRFGNADAISIGTTGGTEIARFLSSGNVGIGTTSPNNKLQIGSVGSSGFSGNDIAIGNGTQVMAFYQASTYSAWFTNTNFVLFPAGAGAIGNLLLGTTTDNGARLQVSGAATFSSSVTTGATINSGDSVTLQGELYYGGVTSNRKLRAYSSGAEGSAELIYSFWNGSAWSIKARLDYTGAATFSSSVTAGGNISNNSSQNIIYSSYDDVAALFQRVGTYGAVIRLGRYGVSNSTTIDYPADGTFAVSTAGSERMRITSGGNVGIGTTSPTGLLHIYGTDPAFRIQNSGTGNMQFGQWDGTNNRIQSSGRDFLLTQTDSFNMLFHTNATERMRITSGGNVGIGTTSPVGELHIVNASGTGQPVLELQQQNAGSNILQWRGSAGSYLGVITNGGNVGIGTTSPIYMLDAYSTGASTARLRIQGTTNFALTQAQNSSGVLYMGVDSSTADGFGVGNYSRIIWSSNAYPLVFAVNDAERMRITSGGNVGIGTTSPTEKLHVNGNIKTAAPTGYTAGSWKLGTANTGTVTANRYITIEIDGQIYTINALLGTP